MAEVEAVDAGLGKIRRADQAVGVVMEEAHRRRHGRETPLETGQGEFPEVRIAAEADEIIQEAKYILEPFKPKSRSVSANGQHGDER